MIIGTCSRCGGTVTVPDVWGGVIPPTPTCSACGATAAGHGPIIQMNPPQTIRFDYSTTSATKDHKLAALAEQNEKFRVRADELEKTNG